MPDAEARGADLADAEARGGRVPDVPVAGAGILGGVLILLLAPLAAAAWVALLAAGIERFSPAAALVAGAAALVAGAAVLIRAVGGDWRAPGPIATWTDLRAHGPTAIRTGLVAHASLLADVATVVVIVIAVVRLAPAATPWPAFLDSSWYVNAGAQIARDGGLRFQPLALAAAGQGTDASSQLVTTFRDQREVGMAVPDDPSRGFHDVSFAVPDVAVAEAMPYHPPFFSSWLAVWSELRGALRIGEGVLPWSAAYLLAAAALARVAFGPWAALAATLLLAAGPAYAYYGRTPFAEIPAGALALAGLAALSATAVRPRSGPRPMLAATGGLLVGLAVLAKAELVLLVPVALVWWVIARREGGGGREAVALAAGLAVPLAHAAALALGPSRLYVWLNAGGVLRLLESKAVLLLGVGLAIAAAGLAIAYLSRRAAGARPGAKRGALLDDAARLTLRRSVAVAVLLVLAVAMARSWLAPPGGPPAMTAILSWLVTPLGLWAAAAGLALALEDGRARSGLVAAVALLAIPAIIVTPAITETLSPLYTARRLVPFAVPVVAVLAGGLAERGLRTWSGSASAKGGKAAKGGMAAKGSGQAVSRGTAAKAGKAAQGGATSGGGSGTRDQRFYAIAVVLGAVLALGNLALTSQPFYRVHSFGGGAALTRALAGYGSPGDIYLFAPITDGTAAGRMAAPLWTLEGRDTAVMAPSSDYGPLSRAVDDWRADGRRVWLLSDPEVDPPPIPGYESAYVDRESIVTRALATTPVLPASWQPLEISVAVHELVPAGESP